MSETWEHELMVCRSELALLRSQVLAQLSHWRALPNAIGRALNYARHAMAAEEISEAERAVGIEIQRVLSSYAIYDDEVPFEQARKLRDETLELLKLSKKLPNSDKPGSLWNELHSTVQQHMESAARGFDDVPSKIDKLIKEMRRSPGEASNRSANYLSKTVRGFRSAQPNMESVSRLLEAIEKIIETLPEVKNAREIHRAIPVHTKRFLLAIIEDNKEWQEFVRHAVDRVRDELGTSFTIDTDLFSNVQDAVAELLKQNKDASLSSEDHGDTSLFQLVAIADMGLPADRSEMLAIQKGETTPSRSNGHELLRRLRSYRTNIPVIVLTTPAYLLEDQLRACAQGIEDCHYILKGPDSEERLVEAILRIIHQAQSHRLDLWLRPKYAARIDGIPIPLTEMPFRTLYALSLLSSRSRKAGYSLERILDQLDETFREDYDYKRPPETAVERSLVLARQRSGSGWSPSASMAIANVIRLWAVRKAECGGNLLAALERLRKENFLVWKNGLSLLDAFRSANPNGGPWVKQSRSPIQFLDSQILSSSFEECFGGLEIDPRPDYELHNLEEHINAIREGVHTAFKELHRHIEPRTEFLVRRMAEVDYGYRILGDIVLHDEPEGESKNGEISLDHEHQARGLEIEDRIRILVVENEELYFNRIASLLNNAGFDTRVATNEQDAVSESLAFQPEILSLDLHIPTTRKEFESNPNSGTANAGLRVLKSVLKESPNIKVMIPTTLFDQDDLRQAAAELKVPATNFVPKGESVNGATWEGQMLLTASRFRQELRSKATLPALPAWRFPVIRILEGSDLGQGRLSLIVNGRESRVKKSNQGRLLSILLRSAGNVVTYAEIDRYVQRNAAKVGDNMRKQWIKNLRRDIRSDWLQLTDESDDRPELEILEAVEGGLILNAHVENMLDLKDN